MKFENRQFVNDGEISLLNILLTYILKASPAESVDSHLSVFHDISQQQQFEQVLYENQRTFLTLLSNLPGMVYRCCNDEHWTIEFISEGCTALTGYTPEELIASHVIAYHDLIHPDDRLQVSQQIQQALLSQKSFQVEYRLLTKAGEWKWFWEQGCGIFSSDAELLCREGFIADITERKRTTEEVQLLQQLTQAISAASDFETALAVALGKVCETTGWHFGEAWIPDENGLVLTSTSAWYCHSQEVFPLPLEEFRAASEQLTFAPSIGLPGKIWASQSPVWIQDVSVTSFFLRADLAKASGLKAGFGVPIIANNSVMAVLVFFMFKSCPEDSRLVELVSTVAAQLGELLQRKQAEAALRQAEAKYRNIFENAIEGIFQSSLEGCYLSANPALAKIYGYDSPAELIASVTNIEQQLYVNPKRRAEFIQQLHQDDAISEFESEVYRRDGSIIWICEKARVVKDEKGNPLYYEGIVEDITEQKRTQEQLHRKAFYDPLTGLPNRALFMKRLSEAITHYQQDSMADEKFAVLFLDLDRFKYINDSLGHLVGDQLLVAIAQRLTECVRPEDTVARLGGDEFTILLQKVSNLNPAIEVAEQILSRLKAPFHLDDHLVFTGASIGILLCNCQVSPEKRSNRHYQTYESLISGSPSIIYESPEEILRDADTALYRAKALGKGRYEVFDHTMHQTVVAQLQLETDLRHALKREEFEICYQPIVSLTTGCLAGFEALLRWWHPRQGLVYPDEFIPMAEETGLIIPIGLWTIKQACYQLRDWQQEFPKAALLTVHVNVSGKQLGQTDIVAEIDKILQETGINSQQLKLEITESCWLKNFDNALLQLSELRKRNIQLCLDDFGTGYSCLSYLHKFPLQALKVDQSFVHRMDRDTEQVEITRTIITLAHNLGMSAIAEGIENIEQVNLLREFGCEQGQGYFFSAPLDAETAGLLIHTVQDSFSVSSAS